MRYLLFTFLGLFLSFQLSSQNLDEKYNIAEEFLYDENFSEAIPLYKDLVEAEPKNSDFHFKLGFCYLQTHFQKDKAIYHLEKSIEYMSGKQKEKDAPIDAYYYLGRAYHATYHFDKAIAMYNKLRKKVADDEYFINLIDKQLEYCRNGIVIMENRETDITTLNLGHRINSKFSDHSPVISYNENVMVFTSRRKGKKDDKPFYDGEYSEDIYISTFENCQWNEPEYISDNVNTNKHEAACAISPDGNRLFIYKGGAIYISEKQGNQWSKPYKAPRPIKKWFSRETHATMSADGKSIYFTSSRNGGYGGLDIYVTRLQDNGKWGKAENLGENVNTPYNEETPYLLSNGNILYFSSEGHNSMGGFDVFKCTRNADNTWSKPENLGYPISTVEDDVFFMPTGDGSKAYYSTLKESGVGSKDLFSIWINTDKQYPVVHGSVKSNRNDTIDAKILIADLKSGEIVSEYLPQKGSGQYSVLLSPCPEHYFIFTAKEHFFETRDVSEGETKGKDEINLDVVLQPNSGTKVIKMYRFNAGEEEDIPDKAEILLPIFTSILNENPNLLVDLSVDKNGDMALNKKIDNINGYFTEEKINADRIKLNMVSDGLNENQLAITFMDTATYQKIKEEVATSIIAMTDEADSTLIAAVTDEEKDIFEANDSTKFVLEIIVDETELATTTDETDNIEISEVNIEDGTAVIDGEVVIIQNMQFPYNKSVTNKYNENLNTLSKYLENNSDAVIEIGGYTDTQGSEKYNRELAKKRAAFVKKHLISQGARPEQVVVKSYGEDKQIAKNKKADGGYLYHALGYNRRVEFKVIKPGMQLLVIQQIDVPKPLRNLSDDAYQPLISRRPTRETDDEVGDKPVFTIRLLTSDKKKEQSLFKNVGKVEEHYDNESKKYYYTTREFNTFDEAMQFLETIDKTKFPKATVFAISKMR